MRWINVKRALALAVRGPRCAQVAAWRTQVIVKGVLEALGLRSRTVVIAILAAIAVTTGAAAEQTAPAPDVQMGNTKRRMDHASGAPLALINSTLSLQKA
mmetsp:Transcript_29865/g.53205  ORF Transcript_29865/g.53205 Transcript_29865/m.53205 type:complete len:100 (-) Transcript_29865:24-323(-)